MLKDKLRNEQTKKYTTKVMNVVRVIEENTTMESDVEWAKTPVNGEWSCWNTTLPCNTSCGGGYRLKNRTCSNPPPSNGGQECTLSNGKRGLKEGIYEKCNTNPCPVDGGFGNWTCDNPTPEYTGKDCVDNVTEVRSCNMNACPGYNIVTSGTCTSVSKYDCEKYAKSLGKKLGDRNSAKLPSGCIIYQKGIDYNVRSTSKKACRPWSKCVCQN